MDARIRFYISFGVILSTLLLKWLTLRVIAVEYSEKWCYRIIKNKPERLNFRRVFRSLGFDFANASAGLLAVAYVIQDSNLRKLCIQFGCFDYLFAILCFVIFILFYVVAAKIQYVFLDTAEKHNSHRWLFGLAGFINGLIMLFNSSWLIVGAK